MLYPAPADCVCRNQSFFADRGIICYVLYCHDDGIYLFHHRKNSMDRLFGILPVRKGELVIGRYVFVLAMGLLSLIISLIAQPLVLKVLGETVGVFDIVTAAIAGVFLFALYTVFQIPGYYKYGSIKGRVFMYIPVAGFLVTLLLLSKMPAIGNSIISVVESSPILLILLVVFAIVVMYAVSIFLSIRVMKNKEM